MKPIKDLINQKFGKWTVVSQAEKQGGFIAWNCVCDCGTEKIITSNSLLTGKSKSCGCYRKEKTIKMNSERDIKLNKYIGKGNIIIGFTINTKKEFYIDADEFEKMKNYCWRENSRGYIITQRDKKYIQLHCLVMDFPENASIDHKDRNKRNNTKSNLVVCSHEQNMKNQNVRKNNKSGIVGVTWDKDKNKWHSYINKNKKLLHLGFFENKDDAIIARFKAENKLGYTGANLELHKKYLVGDE